MIFVETAYEEGWYGRCMCLVLKSQNLEEISHNQTTQLQHHIKAYADCRSSAFKIVNDFEKRQFSEYRGK